MGRDWVEMVVGGRYVIEMVSEGERFGGEILEGGLEMGFVGWGG